MQPVLLKTSDKFWTAQGKKLKIKQPLLKSRAEFISSLTKQNLEYDTCQDKIHAVSIYNSQYVEAT